MKAITVHAFDDEGFENRLQVSLDIARAFDGHLTMVNAIPIEAGVPGDFYGAAFAAMVPVWREGADRLRKKTEADMGNEDVPYDWIEYAGSSSAGLLRYSALSDLMVVGPNEPRIDGGAPSATIGDLVMHGRCPVFVVPEKQNRFDPGAPAVVAWDGSAEASRALRSALPLLLRSSSVYLVCVKEHGSSVDDFDFPPLRGAEYLAHYGIESEIVEMAKAERPVAKLLVEAAEHRGAGMIVMGAYGHWRLAERVFGGVTRGMLSDVKVPLFMTH